MLRYTRPENDAEALARFDLVEDRGDRVLIRLICTLPFAPTECVRKEEVTKCDE